MKNYSKYTLLLITILSQLLLCNKVCAKAESRAGDRETARLTAKLLIGMLKKNLIKDPLEDGVIYDELITNKVKYHSSSESKDLIKIFVQSELAKKFKDDVKEIIDSLNTNLQEGQTNWFTADDLKAFYTFPQSEVLKSLDKQFTKAYTSERRRACNSQWKLLTTGVYPTEQEFTSLESRELYDLLLRRILTKQKERLFEESERYLKTEFIRPIIDDAQTQLTIQIKILAGSTGGDEVLPAGIASVIREELDKAQRLLRRQKANKKIGHKVYSVFKMVEDKIEYRAKDIAATKFSEYLTQAVVPINTASIKRAINDDLASHVLTDKSFELCIFKYETEVIERALELYLDNVDNTDNKFKQFLQRQLVDGQLIVESSKIMVKRSIKKEFNEARMLIVTDQMNDFFTPLQTATWTPEYTLIEREFYKVGAVELDRPLSLKGISSATFNEQLLLTETVENVKSKIKQSIIEARYAMKAQFGLVDSLEQNILSEVGKLKVKNISTISRVMLSYLRDEGSTNSFKGLSDTQKIIALYNKHLLKIWSQKRIELVWPQKNKLPKNYMAKYTTLFGTVVADVSRRVKAMLHNDISVKKIEKPSKAVKAEGFSGGGHNNRKVGTSAGSGAGIGTGVGEVESDVLLDVKYHGDQVEISLNFVNRQYPIKVLLSEDQYGDELNPVVDAFDEWIKTNTKSGEEVRMDIVMRIFDSNIDYGLVAEIRRRIKYQVARKYSQDIEIQWTDMLYTGN